ncbi:unnamed protein product [Closterium sp. Yama58-4]|nr:unnamed protein product [Closterium sp. Yama58-4]
MVLTDTRLPADHNFWTQLGATSVAVISPGDTAGGVAVVGFNNEAVFSDVWRHESGRLVAVDSGHVLLTGDLNIAADPIMDRTSQHGSDAEEKRLLHLCAAWDLKDTFRTLYPSRLEYTFLAKATMTSSRIDRALASASLLPLVADAYHTAAPPGVTTTGLGLPLCCRRNLEKRKVRGCGGCKRARQNFREVAALRHEFMADSSRGEKYDELIKYEAQLKAYRDSQRRRKQTMAGIVEEMNGEIATSFLTQRVASRKAKTTIKEIVYEGKRYEGEREVLTAASAFFAKLFGDKGHAAGVDEWQMDSSKTLDEEARQRLSAPWSEAEVKQAMKELPRGKAPGADGLPKELFEDNWDLLGESVMDFMREFEKSATLPRSTSTAVTILLHKKGDRTNMGNYRPITLLSAIYKIVAKLLANRMKKVLSQVISGNQFGFVRGRRLADAVKVVADTIDAAITGKEDWYLLLVDFQKAYDSVSRPFLFRTLERMGFPAEFVKWTRGLHDQAATQLLVNGWLGERVEVESGVRQGCPLAPYLFICAVEPLSQEAKRRKLGLRKRGRGGLTYLGYADDTTLLLKGKEQLSRAKCLLEDFSVRSGLQVNQGKSTVMPLGKNRPNPPPANTDYNWAERGKPERLLGVWITSDGRAEPTWEKTLVRVNTILTNWEKLHLTTTARVTILNAYVMTVVFFQAQVGAVGREPDETMATRGSGEYAPGMGDSVGAQGNTGGMDMREHKVEITYTTCVG